MVVNTIHATYQEVYDIKTNSGKVSVLGIHTPSGAVPSTMLSGFYEMYSKVKYQGCSLQLVPAARLPIDALQITLEEGENSIDPRDILNPLLFRGCHGESINDILDTMMVPYGLSWTGDSVDEHQFNLDALENMYYQALTDDAFLKSPISSPFRKDELYPLVYNVATNYQLALSKDGTSPGPGVVSDGSVQGLRVPLAGVQGFVNDSDTFQITGGNQQWFSSGMHRMDWLDTHNRVGNSQTDLTPVTLIPKIFMGILILPPAYKTVQYFRMILTHHFMFKDFRPRSLQGDYSSVPGYYNSMETVNATATQASAGVK